MSALAFLVLDPPRAVGGSLVWEEAGTGGMMMRQSFAVMVADSRKLMPVPRTWLSGASLGSPPLPMHS